MTHLNPFTKDSRSCTLCTPDSSLSKGKPGIHTWGRKVSKQVLVNGQMVDAKVTKTFLVCQSCTWALLKELAAKEANGEPVSTLTLGGMFLVRFGNKPAPAKPSTLLAHAA